MSQRYDIETLLCLDDQIQPEAIKQEEAQPRWECPICHVAELSLDDACYRCKNMIYYYMQRFDKDIEDFTRPTSGLPDFHPRQSKPSQALQYWKCYYCNFTNDYDRYNNECVGCKKLTFSSSLLTDKPQPKQVEGRWTCKKCDRLNFSSLMGDKC